MQQRYYDQGVGRFLSVDPVTALSDPVKVFNRYRYAANNPYKFMDPDGRFDRDPRRRPVPDAPKTPGPPPPASPPKPVQPPPPKTQEQLEVEKGRSRLERAEIVAKQEEAKRPLARNDEEDAMRHAEWSRRMAEEVDPLTAWIVGTGHEAVGILVFGAPLEEATMDLNNNAEGRAAAGEGRPVDPTKLQSNPRSTNGRY